MSTIKERVSLGQSRARILGTVKFFSQRSFYGFIAGDDGNDYFAHGSQWGDDNELPQSGDRVSFEVGANAKGAAATFIKFIREGGEVVNDSDTTARMEA